MVLMKRHFVGNEPTIMEIVIRSYVDIPITNMRFML